MLSQAPLRKHNTLFVPLIFIISIAISTCATKPPKVEPLKLLSTQTFKCIKQHERLRVYGNKPPWTKTQITIGEADKIIIFASGAVAMSRNDRYRQSFGLLHLKIGKEGAPEAAIFLDNQNYLKPFDTGDLMFAVQDWRNPENINYDSYLDNSGSYLVDVFVVSENQENYLLKDLQSINAHNSEDETLCSHIDRFLEIHRDLLFADVEVVCVPSNADVFVNSFYQGTAPVVIRNLEKHRSYEICVRFEGYPDSCKTFTPKDASKLSFQLNNEYELVEVKPLTEKLERLVEEKKALEAKLENEASIKKQLQKSLMERELTLKRQEELVTSLYEKDRQLKSKLYQLEQAQRKSVEYEKKLEELESRAQQINQALRQARSDQGEAKLKEEQNRILQTKSALEKEVKDQRAKELKLREEVLVLKTKSEETRKQAENTKRELAGMREREMELSSQVDELKRRLKRGMAPVLVVSKPNDGARIESPTTVLHIIAVDDRGIRDVNVSLNGKPLRLDTKRGIKVATKGDKISKKVDITERLQLEYGQNAIIVSVRDTDGMSVEEVIRVTREKELGKIWAIVIGINRYRNTQNLRYAVNDAKAFEDYLGEYVGIPRDNIFSLVNESATKARIQSLLGTKIKRRAGKDDTVIIFYAGHGAVETDPLDPDGDGFEKYLLPYDANLDDLYSTAIAMKEIKTIFQRIRAERLIFIADTCYSGATGGRTMLASKARATLTEKFFERISKGKGRVIIAACSANEISKEDDSLQHGVFSYYLLKGLKGEADFDGDGIITMSELFSFLSKKVPEASGQDQHPVRKGETEGELVVGRIK